MATATLISVNDVVYEPGIRTLTAYLRRHGHSVRLAFLNEDESEFTQHGLRPIIDLVSGSDLVGISLLSHSVRKAQLLTDLLHVHHPSVPVIWGGIHATGFPHECLQTADLVCLGEGEQALRELLECLSEGLPFEGIENLCFRNEDGAVHRNPVREPLKELDQLPYQDYSLVDEYALDKGRLVPMDADALQERLLIYPFPGMGYVYVTLGSRGCPFTCSFCCNDIWQSLYGKKGCRVRQRSVNHLVGELEDIVRRFPFVQMMLLEDDSFLVRPTSVIQEFAAAYRERVGLPFGIQMNPNEVSYEKLAALKEAGLILVHVGIQSGDDRIRKAYYRRFTSDSKIHETNDVLNRIDVLRKYDIIVDTPFPGDAESSLSMIRRFKGRFAVNLYSLRVYPGLALEEILRGAGYEDWLASNDTSVDYFTILSAEAHTFALKQYLPFPPNWKSRLVARFFSAWPTGTYWMYTRLGGRQLFALYRRARLAWLRLKDG